MTNIMNNYDYLFKFILIGDSGVGKSCIVLQFVQNKTRLNHDVTIGVQFGVKHILVSDKQVKIQIWDTAGQESFRSITRSYYRTAIGALLVYDLTRRQTFDHIKLWLEEAQLHGNPHLQILLVGNKSDLWEQRTVSRQEGQQIAAEYGLNFIEVSAKDYNLIEAAFKRICQQIIKRIQKGQIPIDSSMGIRRGDVKQNSQRLIERDEYYDIQSCC